MSAPAPGHRDAAIMLSGMRATLRLATICLLCLGLAACGGSSGGGSDRQQIQQLFDSIESDLAHGNYAGACGAITQREQATLVSAAKQAGLSASDCAGAFTALTKAAGVTPAQIAQAFGGGQAPKIKSLSVHGDQATVTITAIENGKTTTETDALVKQDGAWKADRALSRSGG